MRRWLHFLHDCGFQVKAESHPFQAKLRIILFPHALLCRRRPRQIKTPSANDLVTKCQIRQDPHMIDELIHLGRFHLPTPSPLITSERCLWRNLLNSDWAREVKRNSVFCDFPFMQNFGYFAQPENEGEADTPYLSLKVNLEIICIPLPLSLSIDTPKKPVRIQCSNQQVYFPRTEIVYGSQS